MMFNYFTALRRVFVAALLCGGDPLSARAGKVGKAALGFLLATLVSH